MASKAPTIVSNISAQRMKDLYGSLALTNQYEVHFAGLNRELIDHLTKFTFKNEVGFDLNRFITADLGLLCSDASLPSSSYATAEVKDNFMGVTQEFAHTRLYTDIDFSFYVDQNYNALRFFEGWMDYISGGNSEKLGEPAAASDMRKSIYRRFVYPDNYKIDTLSISKFNRNALTDVGRNPIVGYRFINAFPKSLTSIPVSYGPSEVMKVTVTMNYDRYIVSKSFVDVNSLTEEQQAELNSSQISEKIVELQQDPNYTGPGSFIFDPSGRPIGIRE
jgi:hypothetical protein